MLAWSQPIDGPLPPAVERILAAALDEDFGRGDVTSEALFSPQTEVSGAIQAREEHVVCGLSVAAHCFWQIDRRVEFRAECSDGDRLPAGAVLARLRGPALAVLGGERVALNFLQRLSGIATLTRKLVEAVAGSGARIADTRKTTPGLRLLERYAVRIGGGHSHRHDLASGVLIKDNHVTACGGVAEAIRRARARAPHPLRIEVEVDGLEQLDQALAAGADIVLLDNFSPAQARLAVERVAGRALVEISGGIRLDTAAAYAASGASILSVGALTHSARAIDLGLDLCPPADPGASR